MTPAILCLLDACIAIACVFTRVTYTEDPDHLLTTLNWVEIVLNFVMAISIITFLVSLVISKVNSGTDAYHSS